MLTIIFYTKENCSLCDDAKAILQLLQSDYTFAIEERDIYTKDEWLEEYQLVIPFVQINDIGIDCEQMSIKALEKALKMYL
ncbi:glutaredoxin family protein [Ornithinibacillus salinisoli]|uniref:Glutaredoxin family protein n=1 Tax=Ornithinibacillus salinisoli TaxID=1848459 RepID=A0ABW4W1Y6_9BACI